MLRRELPKSEFAVPTCAWVTHPSPGDRLSESCIPANAAPRTCSETLPPGKQRCRNIFKDKWKITSYLKKENGDAMAN